MPEYDWWSAGSAWRHQQRNYGVPQADWRPLPLRRRFIAWAKVIGTEGMITHVQAVRDTENDFFTAFRRRM